MVSSQPLDTRFAGRVVDAVGAVPRPVPPLGRLDVPPADGDLPGLFYHITNDALNCATAARIPVDTIGKQLWMVLFAANHCDPGVLKL